MTIGKTMMLMSFMLRRNPFLFLFGGSVVNRFTNDTEVKYFKIGNGICAGIKKRKPGHDRPSV